MFSKEENVFKIYALECRFDSIKTQGLFSKITPKGYPSIWTVGSDPNGPDLKGGDRGGAPAGEEGHAAARHYRRRSSSPAHVNRALGAMVWLGTGTKRKRGQWGVSPRRRRRREGIDDGG
jgi:hypothetical protein